MLEYWNEFLVIVVTMWEDWNEILVIVIGLGGILLSLCYIFIYELTKRIARKKTQDESDQLPFHQNDVDRISLLHISEKTSKQSAHIAADEIKKLQEYRRVFTALKEEIKIDEINLFYNMSNDGGRMSKTKVGGGNFGDVYIATYRAPNSHVKQVACKIIKAGPGVMDFFNEGIRMRKLEHINVMGLIGISYPKDRNPIIVTECMTNGDLAKYVKDETKDRSVGRLMKFIIQIARGMAHLHEHRVIHRDLAARNCMLDDNLIVKIGDFGLARECNADLVYMRNTDRPMPVTWMPIEAIRESQRAMGERVSYTGQGDIWAYGVVLWELMSHGKVPYCDVSSANGWTKETYANGLLQYLGRDRLVKPTLCPPKLYDEVMMPCWSTKMEERPKFILIVQMVEEIARDLVNVTELSKL